MRGAKGIVYKNVAQGSQFAGQNFRIFLLADIKAAVFKQHHFARLDTHAISPVGRQRYVTLHDLAQALRDHSQRIFRLELTLSRPPQMGGHHHGSPGIKRHLDTRHRRPDARVLRNAALRV